MCREDEGMPFEASPMPEGEDMSPWVSAGLGWIRRDRRTESGYINDGGGPGQRPESIKPKQ